MKTKLLTLFLAFAASMGTLFASDTQVNGIWYDFDDSNNTATVTYKGAFHSSYTNEYSGHVTIPASVTYNNKTYVVTRIGDVAFCACELLLFITIPNSVTSIGSNAFFNCTGLTSITIPNSVTSIGHTAFWGCSGLTSVTIGNGVTSIGDMAFYKCNISNITIPSKVTNIGFGAFSDCNKLKIVTIESATPPTMAYMGDDGKIYYAFQNCDNLQIVYVPCGKIELYKATIGWSQYTSFYAYAPLPYTIAVTAHNGNVTTTSTDMYTVCDEALVTCTAIPYNGFHFKKWIDGNTDNPRTIELTQDTTMEAIFDYSLSGKCGKDSVLTWNLDTITMTLDITGNGALTDNYTYGTFIESLTIGNQITAVGKNAFYKFRKLRNVTLGSSVKILEIEAFYACITIETITCYSQRPPTVNNNALYGLDYSTIVYVPADYLNTYKMHDAWGLYDVRPLGAETTETTEVKVTPTDNTATIVWPAVNDAATYELVISDKNGNVICTLIFNANGQLTQIVFGAPSRAQSAGFSFTVTGLKEGTDYDLTITAKNAGGNEIDKKSLSFHTGSSTAIEDILVDDKKVSKFFHNGQIYLRRAVGDRDVKVYTITGQEVR